MEKTDSESLFESYCESKGIAYHRVQETTTRTPDYELFINGQRVVVEVKEITNNPEEEESYQLLVKNGVGKALGHTPGDRVRKKIGDSSAQIKALMKGINPSILILVDYTIWGHLDPYNIRVAMYGLEQVYVALPPIGAGSPYATGMGYGPKRKMTEECNTSISAIGTLVMPGPDEVLLFVYHNKFAEVPLDFQLLAQYGIKQLILGDEVVGQTAKWREITEFGE